MKGLELSRAYWEKCALPLFRRELPAFLERAAVGLVGEGSECFGFDDEISQDHDWGPGFCLWLPEGEWAEWQDAVEALLGRLPDTYEGFPARMAPAKRMGRVGPLSIEGFYGRFIGMPQPPQTWKQWRLSVKRCWASIRKMSASKRLQPGAWAWRRPVNTTCSGR